MHPWMCVLYINASSSQNKERRNMLSTYGAQANSSEKMLMSRFSLTVCAVQRKILNVQHECVERKKMCLSLHLAPWQTTALPRAVLREKVGGEWKRDGGGGVEIKGEKEMLGWSGEGKKKWEQKVDGKSTDVEECIHVSQVKAELWYDQSVYM